MSIVESGVGEIAAASSPSASCVDPLLAVACDQLPYGLALTDPHQRVIFANRRFLAITGGELRTSEMIPLAQLVAPLLSRTEVGGLPANDLVERMMDAAGVSVSTATGAIRLIGRLLPNGTHMITAEENRQSDAPMDRLARQDPLTGLPSRLVLREKLAKAQNGTPVALLCLDLDRFKLVNDALGHPVGDKLLQRVAERLRSLTDARTTVIRLGGDEFAVVQTGGEQPTAATALAERIVDLIGRAYLVEEHLLNTAVSVGIALAPRDGSDPDRLLKSADLALHHAKDQGRGCYRLFEPAMDARLQTRRSLEFDLRKALGLREFELYYQPQFNFERNRVQGCEALLRWRHSTRGMVSPADFVPLAEEIGLIIPIGEWVLRTACTEAARWPEHMSIAVNLSAVQFTSPRLVQSVISALAISKLEPSRLELEITEGVLLQDTSATLTTLHQLRDLGVRISMDDFGTGYSSLSYLRKFPFDKIKIDQSFVRGMQNNKDCVAIVRAIAGLGASLGMTTTAEGVETGDQFEWVRREGCTDIQGYLISKPVPATEIAGLFAAQNNKVA